MTVSGSNSAFASVITNAVAESLPDATNAFAATALSSNMAQIVQAPLLPPLPQNEPRTFHLKNGTNYVGVIISADRNGLIIKLGPSEYTPRLAWNLFDEEALAREPKVIAFKKAQQAAREAAERVRIAAAETAERARIEKAEAERRLAEYHAKQDALIEASISESGWKSVTKGYLKAWGSEVSIGEIFAVVAPSASWSAGKLASYEPERYTHYLVEAKWTNDKGQPVAMQYLVTADGSDFHLHGCFVSGSKMADLPFLLAVKDIWNRQK